MYLIGYILKPQGVKGEVKVDPVTQDPDRFKQLKKVYIQFRDNLQTYSIQHVRVANRFVYLKFSEINSREDAEFLRDAEILIDKSNLIQPSQDEYFIHDLIGCRVISEKGTLIGIVTEVVQMSSNDIYVINNKEGNEILIPAIKDVVRQVDISQKLIIIKLLEGLLD